MSNKNYINYLAILILSLASAPSFSSELEYKFSGFLDLEDISCKFIFGEIDYSKVETYYFLYTFWQTLVKLKKVQLPVMGNIFQ